jgi:hypothetical protein
MNRDTMVPAMAMSEKSAEEYTVKRPTAFRPEQAER